MTKLKVGLLLLVVLLVGGGSVAADSASSRHISTSSQPAAAWSAGTTHTARTALLPSQSATRPCVIRETAVPQAQCACPPSLAAAPSVVPCNTCPIATEDPSNVCPPIQPTSPPNPPGTPIPPPAPSVAPVITFCPTTPVAVQTAPGTIQLQGYVCGRGFRVGETVTLTATGGGHSVSWQLQASSSGTFASPLPPLLCRLGAPITLVATGSTGDRSNSLLLSATSCLPTL
jgi:hypothetical protein